MTKRETFSRKEVINLLRRQIAASANSYGKMPVNEALTYSSAYGDELIATAKRLRRVRVIKF